MQRNKRIQYIHKGKKSRQQKVSVRATQVSDLFNKDIKVATINVFKKLKETMF